MKTNFTYLLLFLFQVQLSAQGNLLAFDLNSGDVDTIPVLDIDETISKESTDYFVGQFDNEVAILDTESPTENLFNNGSFTELEISTPTYDSEEFPLRTTVNIYKVENGEFEQICSGNMVSRKHVLTSGFCVIEETSFSNDSLLLKTDSLVIFPALDQGSPNESFPCATVVKAYIMENAEIGISDMTLLELDLPVGDQTGWVGIGFNENEEELREHIYYKFSYPNKQIPGFDNRTYFGDTMYYRYGKVDMIASNNTFVMSGLGRAGEGGSNLIEVKNNSSYTSFGTLGYSANLRHSKFQNNSYFAFKQIMQKDLIEPTPKTSFVFKVFPNPTTDLVNIQFYKKHKNTIFRLIDPLGRVLRESKLPEDIQHFKIDMRFFDTGSYFIQIESDTDIEAVQFMKF